MPMRTEKEKDQMFIEVRDHIRKVAERQNGGQIRLWLHSSYQCIEQRLLDYYPELVFAWINIG